MNDTVKVFVFSLIALAGVALFNMRGNCEHDHDVQSPSDCACVCCCGSDLSCTDLADGIVVGIAVRGTVNVRFPGVLCTGTLVITDIFRPPTTA